MKPTIIGNPQFGQILAVLILQTEQTAHWDKKRQAYHEDEHACRRFARCVRYGNVGSPKQEEQVG